MSAPRGRRPAATDPIKLARWLAGEESRELAGVITRPHHLVTLDEGRLIAAALRGMEARIAYSDLHRRPPVSDFEDHRRRAVETDDAFIAANTAEASYRAARGIEEPCGTCGGTRIIRKFDATANEVFGAECPECRGVEGGRT